MTIIENSRQTCAEIVNQIEKEIRNYEVYLSQIETYKRQIKDKKQEISRLKNLLSSADKSEIPFIRQKIEEEENLIKWLPGSIQTAKQQAENSKALIETLSQEYDSGACSQFFRKPTLNSFIHFS